MNEVQVTRTGSRSAVVLRELSSMLGAERCRALALYWTDGEAAYYRVRDLDAAGEAIHTAYAAFIRYGSEVSDPVEHVREDAKGSRPCDVRRRAYMDRIADMLAAMLRGEHVEIPGSSDLGAYPPTEAA